MNVKILLLFVFCFTCWISAKPVLARHSSDKDFSKDLLQNDRLIESEKTQSFLQKYPRKANKQTFLGPYNAVLLSTNQETETETEKETASTSTTTNEKSGLTSDQMDEIISQLKTSLDGVSENVKASLEKATNNATAHMAQQVEELSKDVQRSIGKIETGLEKEGNKTRQEVTMGSEKINKEILRTQRKIDANTVETRAIRITMLEQELEDKEEELKQLEERINQLKEKLPPPTSICNQYLDCGTCTVNPRCGWCTAEQKCVEGDVVGPLYETCNFYDYKICSGSTCGRYKDCSSCIQDPFCGWCASEDHQSGSCLERQADYEGCPMNDWFHSAAVKNRCDLPQPSSANPLNTSIIESVEGKNALEKERKEREDRLKLQATTNEQHKQILQMQDELIKDQQKAEVLRGQIATLKGTVSRLKVSQTESEKQITEAEKEDEEEKILETQQQEVGEVEAVAAGNVNESENSLTEKETVTTVEASVDHKNDEENPAENETEATEGETVVQVETTVEEDITSSEE